MKDAQTGGESHSLQIDREVLTACIAALRPVLKSRPAA